MRQRDYNHGHNILELYNVLIQTQLTTSKTKRDIYYSKLGTYHAQMLRRMLMKKLPRVPYMPSTRRSTNIEKKCCCNVQQNRITLQQRLYVLHDRICKYCTVSPSTAASPMQQMRYSQ